MPETRFLYVGKEWDDSAALSESTGMRDAYWESLLETSPCKPGLKETSKGHAIWGMATDASFTVDPESVAMIEDFELDRLIDQYRKGIGHAIPGSITHGYKWYMLYGVIQLSGSQMAKHDEILRRTAHKDRLGLCMNYDIADLVKRSVRYSEMPHEAREAWAKKATTSSAQADLVLTW
jgi:DNA sulfur modification protein DndC